MNQMFRLPASDDAAARPGRAMFWARRHPFLLLVIVPTLLAGIYLFLIASSQYRSEAQFIVRGLESQPPRTAGVGQLLGLYASSTPGQEEAQSIREYLRSHDAVQALRARGIDLATVYSRSGIDPLSRLRSDAQAETLLDYYRDHVDVAYDPDDNITRLSVRAFDPQTARQIAIALLKLGEARVNAFNARLFDASLRAAENDVAVSERELAGVQAKLGVLRERNRDIDPAESGQGGIQQLAGQQAELDLQQAMLADMRRQLSPASPQVQAMAGRVAALQASLGAARARLAGTPNSVAARLGDYEDLRLQQDFAAKRLEATRGHLEEERVRATKERLFIVPVVEPNLPEKPALPKPLRATLLIFLGLSLAYGIGWMLLAGVREHQD